MTEDNKARFTKNIVKILYRQRKELLKQHPYVIILLDNHVDKNLILGKIFRANGAC